MALDYNLEIKDDIQELKNQIDDIKRRIKFEDIFYQSPGNENRYSLKKDSIVWNYLMNEKLSSNAFVDNEFASPTHTPISNYSEACLDIKAYYYKEEFDFIIHEFFIRQKYRFIKGKDPVYFIKTDSYLDKNNEYRLVYKTHLSCNLELYNINQYTDFYMYTFLNPPTFNDISTEYVDFKNSVKLNDEDLSMLSL